MGTEKRERQRTGRIEKTVAQAAAAKRAKRRSNAIRIAVGTVLVLAVVFITSQLMGDDSDSAETSGADDNPSETIPPETTAPDTTQPEYSNPELAEAVLARQPPIPAPPPADTAADALESSTLIEGEGAGAQAGDTVVVHYSGVLSDGSPFDQSWERGQTFPVTLGQGQVIPGWDEGLVGAKIGERRHLVIGSDNAYGAQGRPPDIPANAPLAFDVDIVDIQPAG